MEQYHVTGMSCAACSTRVEKAVSAVPGVTSCSVSLLTHSMGVEGTAAAGDIIKAVTDAGYGASLKSGSQSGNGNPVVHYDDVLIDTETPKLKKRLIASVLLLIPLMYESMGHMLWNWPLPAFLDGNHVGMGIYEMLLAGLIMVINQKFFISGFKGLIHKAPNMDTLVAMGSSAAFAYSVFSVFAMSSAFAKGDTAAGMSWMNEFYFESAATILTLITVGKMLEARSKGKTTDALKSLMKLAPKSAVLLRDGAEVEVPVEEVRVGDRFVVRSGASIPVDGIVTEGNGAVNEAALTGESIPVDKQMGDTVSAATVNLSGYLVCEATRIGEDTTLSQIIRMVGDAAATKAPIAKLADRVSGIFVPAVISIAAVTFAVWMLTGQTLGYALARAISVLVISCPCALGLATPVAIMVGNGQGARNGILFKTAAVLEETGRVQIVALDKTGTITRGEPVVKEILPADGVTGEKLLEAAYALEQKSEHPLAKAIVAYAQGRNMAALPAEDFHSEAGHGLHAVVDGRRIYGGKPGYIAGHAVMTSGDRKLAETKAGAGMTTLCFADGNRYLGMITVADEIREDSAKAIARMKKLGIHVVMLTGDNAGTAETIGREAGVDEVVSDVLPEGKEEVIRLLQEKGKVAMVGDGINDAPALTRADVGIAVGAGTDVAIDAADIVLMKNSLMDVSAAIRLSRATLKNIRENLFWAFFYNVIGIPLAAGLWIPVFGWTLNPMFGAAAMGLSSFCVVTNALRLNLFRLYDVCKDKPLKNAVGHEPLLKGYRIKKEENTMMEIKVKGMMCCHCEAHVKKALEKVEGVTEAVPDHTSGTVKLTVTGNVDAALLKIAVEDAGYEYIG